MKKASGLLPLGWLCLVLLVLAVWGFYEADNAFGGDAGTLVLHVRPEGRDNWSGRLTHPKADGTDGPLASITGARDAIRAIRKTVGLLRTPVRVEIAAGTYRLSRTIRFTPADSGTKACPITYAAAPGAAPVISGGRVITGWQRVPSGKLWTAQIPDVKTSKWYFRQLFVDGKRYVRARDPDEKDCWYRATRIFPIEETRFLYENGDIKPWRSGDPVEVVLLRTWDSSRLWVSAIDRKTLMLRFRMPEDKSATAHWKGDRRYYLENSFAYLDSPGEWYLDKKQGTLYVWPLEGCDIGRARVVAPALEQFIRFEGLAGKPIKHITFRGLAFSYSSWTLPEGAYAGHQAAETVGAAIEGDFVESCAFEDCRFKHLGKFALWLRQGCRNNLVTRCEFFDLAGGAVKIGEPVRQSVPIKHKTSSNEVSHNHIHNSGRVWKGCVGIWVGPVDGTRIAHNHIHDLPYSGISVGWTWNAEPSGAHHNIIEHNHIHDVVQSMSDGGGIYTLGLQPGTVIRNNIIHDNPGYEPRRWAEGIYMDMGSSEMLIENNLICRVANHGIKIGYGNRNIVRNNIFALAGKPLIFVSQKRCKDNLFERNLFILKREMASTQLSTESARFHYNLYYQVDGLLPRFTPAMNLKKWQAAGRDKGSIVANPGFTDIDKGDFTLKPGSPAFKVGFKPLKIPPVGPPRYDYASRLTASLRNTLMGKMTRRPVPSITVPRPSSTIVIDGRLTEKAWKDIQPTPLSDTKVGPPHDPVLHRARIACDGKNLYVLIVSDIPNMERLHADGAIWNKNDFAVVCLQGVSATDTTPTPIYRISGYASGSVECSTGEGGRLRHLPALKKAVRYAVTVGKNQWTGEWKIPLAPFGIDLSRVKELRFNLGVRRPDAENPDRKWGMWLYTGFEVWHLRHAGLLVVEKDAK